MGDRHLNFYESRDNLNWFAETSNANNSTWVDLKLTGSSVRVVAYGPVA
ncbi:MAG TPA: hypothetical protein VFC13_20760 [Actinomycetes bacterium]|nr:hypothetical protein [Actinomycetes bacterium]